MAISLALVLFGMHACSAAASGDELHRTANSPARNGVDAEDGRGTGQHAASKPNVLILFADDLGSGDLGVYGHPTTYTPNLNEIASEGLRFTQWYSAFHVCSPSRAAMLTGRIPIRSGCAGASWMGGVFNSDAAGGLPTNETTIADELKKAGYATQAIGKWHLGQKHEYLPPSRGFDHYFGIPYSVDMGPSAWNYYTSEDRPPLPLMRDFTVLEQPTDLNKLSQRYVDEAVSFMNYNTKAQKPWLVYYAFNHVHTPDFASQDFCNKTKRGRFGDALMELDFAAGALMDGLKSAGAENNTITFFTSDNGPWLTMRLAGGSAGLLRDGKTTTWEGGIREPGLIHWPGKILPGISTAVVATYDIFATSLALAGVPLPSDRFIDGVDLSPVIFGANGRAPDPNIEVHDCLFHYKGTPNMKCPDRDTLTSMGWRDGMESCPGLWAVRCGPHKLHYVTKQWDTEPVFQDPPLVYHVENDPGETFPLDPNSAEYVHARATIEAAVAKHKQTVKPVPNMMALGLDPDSKICCDPNSMSKHPNMPNCTCNPENFDVFVCIGVWPNGCNAHGATPYVPGTSWPWPLNPSNATSADSHCAAFPAPPHGSVKKSDATTWPVQERFVNQAQ